MDDLGAQNDDLETDEQGIYYCSRRNSEENGLMVDEDGIWHDDDDYGDDAETCYTTTGNIDSGFCTAEQKSSSSLVSRIQDGDDNYHGNQQNLDYESFNAAEEEEEDLERQDENSYNISELEASCSVSVPGSEILDHHHHLLHHHHHHHEEEEEEEEEEEGEGGDSSKVNSDAASATRYPELAQGYFTSESERSREREKRTAAGHQGDPDYMAYYRVEEPYYTTNDEDLFSDFEKYDDEFYQGFPEAEENYTLRNDGDNSDQSGRKVVRDDGARGRNRNYDDMEKREKSNKEEEDDDYDDDDGANVLEYVQSLSQDQHSLDEFEQLEANMEEGGGNDDFIGVYLKEGDTGKKNVEEEIVRSSKKVENNGKFIERSENNESRRSKKVHSSQTSPGNFRNVDEAGTKSPDGVGILERERILYSSSRKSQKSHESRKDGHRSTVKGKSEPNGNNRSEDLDDLLQKTSAALVKMNQKRDAGEAKIRSSQIPILRSRSSSLSRPGSRWSRSNTSSTSLISSPQPSLHGSNAPEKILRSNVTLTPNAVNSELPKTQRTSKRSETLDSRKNDQYSLSSSSRHSDFESDRNDVSNKSYEVGSLMKATTLLLMEERQSEESGDVISNFPRHSVHSSPKLPTRTTEKDLEEDNNDNMQNYNDLFISSTSDADDRRRIDYIKGDDQKTVSSFPSTLQSNPSFSGVTVAKRSSSVGSLNRRRQPLKAMAQFMKTSVPDAIGVTSASLQLAPDDDDDDEPTTENVRLDFRKMYLAESNIRKMTEETYAQLQVNYNVLLKQHAEAKNTVDTLRLGAKVNLYSNAPDPVNVQHGMMPAAQRVNVFTMSKMGVPSIGYNSMPMPTVMKATLSEMTKPRITEKLPSGDVIQVGDSGLEPNRITKLTPMADARDKISDTEAEIASVKDDCSSFIYRIKSTEEQLNDLKQHLTKERDLNFKEQKRRLEEIKNVYNQLGEDFDSGHMEEENLFPNRKQEMESRLVQLHLTIGQLEDIVEENSLAKTMKFSTDKILDQQRVTNFASTSDNDKSFDLTIPGHHSPSVAGILDNHSIDRRIEHFHKEYTKLMDRYRQLKQMKGSRERDDGIASVLSELKKVYIEIPEHRKPGLPSELEKQYSPRKGSFIDSSFHSDDNKMKDLQLGSTTSAEVSTVINDCEQSTASKSESVPQYTSSSVSNRTSSRDQSSSQDSNSLYRRDRFNLLQNNRPLKGASSTSSQDSLHSSERVKPGNRRLPRVVARQRQPDRQQQQQQPHTMGMEKVTRHEKLPVKEQNQSSSLSQNHQFSQKRGRKLDQNLSKTESRLIRTSARTPPLDQVYSETDSDATDDTVEEIFKSKKKSLNHDQNNGTISNSKEDESRQGQSLTSSVGRNKHKDSLNSVTEEGSNSTAGKRLDESNPTIVQFQSLQPNVELRNSLHQPVAVHPSLTNPAAAAFHHSFQAPPYLQPTVQQASMHELLDSSAVAMQQFPYSVRLQPMMTYPNQSFVIGAENTLPSAENYGKLIDRGGYLVDTRGQQQNRYSQFGHPSTLLNANKNDYRNGGYHSSGYRGDSYNDGHNRRHDDRHSNGRWHRDHGDDKDRTRRRHRKFQPYDADEPLPSEYFQPSVHSHPQPPGRYAGQETSPFQWNQAYQGGGFPADVPENFANQGLGSSRDDAGVGSSGAFPAVYEDLGITSRGIQNVPLMNSTGVQYFMDGVGQGQGGVPSTPYSLSQGARIQGGAGHPSFVDQPIVITGTACPFCGRVEYHTHEDIGIPTQTNYNSSLRGVASGNQFVTATPSGVHATNLQPSVPFVGNGLNLQNLRPILRSGSSDQVTTLLNHGYHVNHRLNTSKVRYYVREYGGLSTDDETRAAVRSNRSKRRCRIESSDNASNSDNDEGEVDWTLNKAMMTAKVLKKLSEEMKTSLRDELMSSASRSNTLLLGH